MPFAVLKKAIKLNMPFDFLWSAINSTETKDFQKNHQISIIHKKKRKNLKGLKDILKSLFAT